MDQYDIAAVIGALCKMAEELEKIRHLLAQMKTNATDEGIELREQLRVSVTELESRRALAAERIARTKTTQHDGGDPSA
jgi:uncharacterized small protein (DUF1192 family)